MNLVERLEEHSRDRPEAIALVDRNHRFTFAELSRATRHGAAQLVSEGLRRGDAVLFFHPVSVELYTGLLSVMRAGMKAVFIDPSASPEFFAACCRKLEISGFFGSGKAHLLRLKHRELRKIRIRFHTSGWVPRSTRWAARGDSSEERFPVVETAGDDHALITFTSGSTGTPKGVARSHRFLLNQHASLERSLGLQAGQTDLVTLPIFTLANLASGVTSVLADTDLANPGKVDRDQVINQISSEKVDRIVASPAFFDSLLAEGDGLEIGEVDKVFTGGAPVFPRLLDLLRQRFPNASEISAVYGSTEAEPIAELSYRDIGEDDLVRMQQGDGLLAGRPVPGLGIKIVEGEILVTGEHVLKGYLRGEGDAETKVEIDGEIWHRTGDLGRLEEDGRLWLLGRKAVVNQSAITPFAVECAASFLSEKGRTAILELEGELILFAEKEVDASDQLKRLADQFGITQIRMLDKIPMDRRHNAKVDYPALRELVSVRS
ncbi:MAG: AMP-binding protein [Verrucomicrobiota bacterium]